MTSARSRKTKAMRLSELGITEIQFEQFQHMFCPHRLRRKYIKLGRDGWLTCHFPWDDRMILMHLTHEETIGLFPADRIDYLMLDIDNHDPKVSSPVADRARRIINVFDADSLVYTSSDSGGLRVCHFLDKLYPREVVLDFTAVKLNDAGLKISSGYIEILAQAKGDRLPFGEGSFLADPHTFEPLYDVHLTDMIKYAWNLRSGERLHIEDSGTVSSKGVRRGSEFWDLVTRLTEEGLPPNLTTSEALKALNWANRAQGMSAHESERWLRAWIRAMHNNNSRRFNAGRIDDIDGQIVRISKSYNPDKARYRSRKTCKATKRLTIGDAQRVIQLFPDYRMQLATFSLLVYVKAHGELLGTVDITDTSNKEEDNTGYLNVLGFLQNWKCEIPYMSFLYLDGFDKTHPGKTRKLLEEIGLIELHEMEDRSRNKCRTYLIHFTFDQTSDEVVSLNEALLQLKTPEELARDYSRYRSARIMGASNICS